MRADRPAVLFLWVHSAGRSQMAAGWLCDLAGDAVAVFLGGSSAASELNPTAVAAMAEVGIDIAAEVPRLWSDEILEEVDVVVTMGCGDACPVVPGSRYEDWEVPDPAGQPTGVVRAVRDDIAGRVGQLIASLDLVART
jgi:arsenate reductase